MSDLSSPLTIDEARRELRVGARTIDLEPRVFDLVAYLAAHAERVVSKDELLDAVWPDLEVGDGSLQRAVSIARAALRDAGLDDPIRTFARRGYRFCLDTTDGPFLPAVAPPASSVAEARAAFDARDWQRTVREFARADAECPLGPEELEVYAHAVLRSGELRQAPAVFARAVEAFVTRGDRKAGARVAVTLGMVHWQCGDLALARGWQRRAAGLVAGTEDCRETGLVAWFDAFIRVLECDLEEGTRRAHEVYETGVRLGDPDLKALGCAFSALGSLATGRTEAALLLDEVAAAVVSGEVSFWVASHILCATLWGYRSVADWVRASQSAEQYVRWCDRTGMENSPGTWRLHRVEALANNSDLKATLEEALTLPSMLAKVAPWAVGDSWRVIGELLVVHHDLDAAQAAFEEAGHQGWDPQPGLALLQLGRGRPEAAVKGLVRSIQMEGFLNGQRRPVFEGYLVLALAAAGEAKRAAALADELAGRPGVATSPALQALVARGRAEIAALEGRLGEAAGEATVAARHWSEAGSPLHEARSRLRLAQLLLADSDFEGADVEAGIALRMASRLNARALETSCEQVKTAIRNRAARLLAMPELGPWDDEVLEREDSAPRRLAEPIGPNVVRVARAG